MSEELRKQFELETECHWENYQGEPDIEYVQWLESKLNTRPETKPLIKCPKCGKENEPDTAHTCNQGNQLTVEQIYDLTDKWIDQNWQTQPSKNNLMKLCKIIHAFLLSEFELVKSAYCGAMVTKNLRREYDGDIACVSCWVDSLRETKEIQDARIKELEADYEKQIAAFAELTYIAMDQKKSLATLAAENKELLANMRTINESIGKWMSAAMDDKTVCKEMKADIQVFFDALPGSIFSDGVSENQAPKP
jgi:uncharacterized coiled-coil protein SlyX